MQEMRLGNLILQKSGQRIIRVPLSLQHMELYAKDDLSTLYPVVLKPEVVEKLGFVENKKYPLLPDAREFRLVLPVPGGSNNDLFVYSKNNGECFGRATVNGAVASQNFFQLHQLQNLYYSLTGTELDVSALR